jgi:hypothetical protein
MPYPVPTPAPIQPAPAPTWIPYIQNPFQYIQDPFQGPIWQIDPYPQFTCNDTIVATTVFNTTGCASWQ